MFIQLDNGLSDRELLAIGQIIVQWGALEHEIFNQLLLTFDEDTAPGPPEVLRNFQLARRIELWKERVIDAAPQERAEVLTLQLEEIVRLKDARDALVHGMWHWSVGDLTTISTVRVRKEQVITTHFTAEALEDFGRRLADINFKIRYPGGVEEFAGARAEQGSGFSRMGLALLTGDPMSRDWLSARSFLSKEKEDSPVE
jgi:hypothetical protein